MLSQALTAASDVYKENARISALLDDKAQKTATIAGIFLAAAFAFLRRESVQDLKMAGGLGGMLLFGASLAFFLLCIVASGLVLWVRKLRLPPDPNRILTVCDLLLHDPAGPSDDARENHMRDQTRSWNRANETQDQVISDKSKKLLAAQWLLLLGIMAAAGLLSMLVFAPNTAEPVKTFQLIPIHQRRNNVEMRSMRQGGPPGQQPVQDTSIGWRRRYLHHAGR